MAAISSYTQRFEPTQLVEDIGLHDALIAFSLRLASLFDASGSDRSDDLPVKCFFCWSAGLAVAVAELQLCGAPMTDGMVAQLSEPVIVSPKMAAGARLLGLPLEDALELAGVEYIMPDEDLQRHAFDEDPDS